MSFTAEDGPVTFDIDDTDVYEYKGRQADRELSGDDERARPR